MPRRREVPKRRILPDPKFKSVAVAKFINGLMVEGKKSTAESIFYDAMDAVSQRMKVENPIEVFEEAMRNAEPRVEVKSRRVGGSTYQVPVEIRAERREALARRWIISYSRTRGEKSMTQRLAAEIMDAAANRGNAVKKKEDTHRMAEANKAYAHYRW